MRWVPNALTASRLVLLLPLMVLLYGGGPASTRIAFAVFLVAGATDLLDGFAARRLRCESPLGAFFDPLADKIFANLLLTFLACHFPKWVPPWCLLLLLAREFAVQGFRSMAPCVGIVLRTGLISKSKLVFQLTAVGTCMAGLCDFPASRALLFATWAALGLALISGYSSMALLFWKNKDLWCRPAMSMEVR